MTVTPADAPLSPPVSSSTRIRKPAHAPDWSLVAFSSAQRSHVMPTARQAAHGRRRWHHCVSRRAAGLAQHLRLHAHRAAAHDARQRLAVQQLRSELAVAHLQRASHLCHPRWQAPKARLGHMPGGIEAPQYVRRGAFAAEVEADAVCASRGPRHDAHLRSNGSGNTSAKVCLFSNAANRVAKRSRSETKRARGSRVDTITTAGVHGSETSACLAVTYKCCGGPSHAMAAGDAFLTELF